MHLQNLVKFYQFALKILSGKEIMTHRQMDVWNDKSSIAPLFQSGAINITFFSANTKYISSHVEKILAFSLVLHTRKKY